MLRRIRRAWNIGGYTYWNGKCEEMGWTKAKIQPLPTRRRIGLTFRLVRDELRGDLAVRIAPWLKENE